MFIKQKKKWPGVFQNEKSQVLSVLCLTVRNVYNVQTDESGHWGFAQQGTALLVCCNIKKRLKSAVVIRTITLRSFCCHIHV